MLMTKKYFLILLLLCNFLIYAQDGSISISGPDVIEVGISQNFSFSYTPSSNATYDSYRVTQWQVSATYHLEGEIPGHINHQDVSVYNDFNTTGDLIIPIQWGSDVPVDQAEILAHASGEFLDENGYVIGYFNTGFLSNFKKEVQVKRICPPSIAYGEVKDCEENTFEITAEAYCSADLFEWSLSDGTVQSGNGTSQIIVKPPLTGNFTATVVAKRTSGNSAYTKSTTTTVVRTAQEAEMEIIHNQTSTPTYICKGIGQEFAIENQDNIASVDWSAPNSTISSETVSNGKRSVIITPNSSFSNGSSLSVNATVYYVGGCTALVPGKTLTVYEAEIPPTPQGYVYMEPLPEGTSVCEAQGFEVIFVASNPYNNGSTSWSPTVLPPHAANNPYPISVCYTNPCSGQQTCTTFYTSPPASCDGPKSMSTMTLTPNPTRGTMTVEFDQKITGIFNILDSNGVTVKRGEIRESDTLDITLSPRFKSGYYFIEIQTAENKITKQIILER